MALTTCLCILLPVTGLALAGNDAAASFDALSLFQTSTDPELASHRVHFSALQAHTVPKLQSSAEFENDLLSDDKGKVYVPPQAPQAQEQAAPEVKPAPVDWFRMKGVVAEYIAMTLFVVVGCGTAMSVANAPGSAWILQVSVAFGLAITVLAYSIGHFSGGHINCAVTFALLITGNCGWWQAVCNFFAQMLGSITGAAILAAMHPRSKDLTGSFGCNKISDGYTVVHALVGEAVMTFLLVFVVLQTAVNPDSEANRQLAAISIGAAVFLAHSVLIPIDGCSINPTRSFGPALVSMCVRRMRKDDPSAETNQELGPERGPFHHMWVFWLAPGVGAAVAAGVYALFRT